MSENNKNLNIKFNKSREKITTIKPIIKLETNPEILKNLKEVFSSQKIKDQIKSAVNKLQADDALPSHNSTGVIHPEKIKSKQKLRMNSVKETLRTSILHKTANIKMEDQVKNYSSSKNYKNYPETIRVPDVNNIKTYCSNKGVNKNVDTNTVNSTKMLNENNLSKNITYEQPTVLNSRAYMASNNSLNNKIKTNSEPIENSQYPIHVNILNGKNTRNYEFSILGNNDISIDSFKKNKEYILKLSNSGTRKDQPVPVPLNKSESDIVHFNYNIQENSHKTLKKKHLPATVTTNNFSKKSPNTNEQSLNMKSTHTTLNGLPLAFQVLVNNKRKSVEAERNFTLHENSEKSESKPDGNRRKKINSNTNIIDSNKTTSRKIKKILNNNLISAHTNQIFTEENNSNLNVEFNASRNIFKSSKISTPHVMPEIKIQKAGINIEGIQTNNYKADILEKRFLNSESSKKTESPIKVETSEEKLKCKEEKTVMAINFIKKALEKKSLFKSPETPPRNKIDDVNFQNEFLMNEIEEYKNQNKDFIKTEENFHPQNQPIHYHFTNNSPGRNESGNSPKLIQDLDSKTIFKHKSTEPSAKLIPNLDSNAIFNNNFNDSLNLVNPINTCNPIEITSKEFDNNLSFKHENVVDAVDFLCNLDKNFEKDGCDDDEEDDVSEGSFNIDDSEILRPEDFLQNISKSLLSGKILEDKINENDLLNNINIRNCIIDTEASNKLYERNELKSTPIVIENKILADNEKINLNLCLNGSVQIENIKKIVDNCSNIPVTESKNQMVSKNSLFGTVKIENLNNNYPFEIVNNNNIENKLQSAIPVTELNVSSEISEKQSSCNVENYVSNICNEINVDQLQSESISNTESNNENNFELNTSTSIIENQIIENITKHNENLQIDSTLLEAGNTPEIQHNKPINEEVVLASHALPLINEEIVETTDTSTNLNNLPLIDTTKNSMQNTKPKTVQISSRRPGLKGSKINLVQRRKGQKIINKNNNLSKKPENEENPSISPHLSQENLEATNEKNLNEHFQKNTNFVEQIIDSNENISKEIQQQENHLLSSKIDHHIMNNYNSINCLDNTTIIENQNFCEKNNDLQNKNLVSMEMNTFEEVPISTIDNSYNTNSNDFNDSTEVTNLSDNNINTDVLQTNNEEDISNESDLSKSEFKGFDLSCIINKNYSMETMYNTFKKITNKIKDLQSESCSAINKYSVEKIKNDDDYNSNTGINDKNLIISHNENPANNISISIQDIKVEKDLSNIIVQDTEHLKINVNKSLPETVIIDKNFSNLIQNPEKDSDNVSYYNNTSNSSSYSCFFDTENSNQQRKLSSSSKNSIKKRQKTSTSDSDSFGEDDCVPLKKRPIRNTFSNNSFPESEQTRKENKIMILEKRVYFSTRKDSETSTSSDHHYSISGFNSPNVEILEKSLENKIDDSEINKKIKISNTECFDHSENLLQVEPHLQEESKKNHKKSEKNNEKFESNSNSENQKNKVELCFKLDTNSKGLEPINNLAKERQINSIVKIEKKTTKDEHLNLEDFTSEKPLTNEKQLNVDSESKEEQTNKNNYLNSVGLKSKNISSNERKHFNQELLDFSLKSLNQNTALKSDNSDTKNKKNSKSLKTIRKESKKKDQNESDVPQTTSKSILDEDFSKSLINDTLLHVSSTPISKIKKRKTEKNEKCDGIDENLKKKKKKKESQIDNSSASSPKKTANIDKQMIFDSFVIGLPQNNPTLENNLLIKETVKVASTEKKKRVEKRKTNLKPKNDTSLIRPTQTNKDSAFDKFYKTLMPKERKKGKKISGQRKLPPNILLIKKRCDIETFKIDDTTTKPPNENEIVCGLCKETVLKKSTEWINHISTHYGVGWIEGNENIDVTQYHLVLSVMINFMKIANIKALKCRMCNTEFKSALGVLTHLLLCGLREEDKRNETHIACEYCNNFFHFLYLKLHVKNCSVIKRNQQLQDSNTTEEVVLSNTGRYKRKSTVKAENKLKEIENDCDKINVKNFIKTIPAVRGGIYRKWKKEIESGHQVKCCGDSCEEIFNDINLLKKHINSCNKIAKRTYRCKFCKYIDLNLKKVKEHIQGEHEKVLKNLSVDHSGSEVDYSKQDLSVSSEDCSSGVDENEVSNGEEEEENYVVSDEERSKIKKDRKNLSDVKNKIQSIPKFKNSFMGKRMSFMKVAEKVQNWTKFFITGNYSFETLFPSCLPKFEPSTDINRNDYEPQNDISMKFSFSETEVNSEFGSSRCTSEKMELERFKWIQNKNELLLYIGGPITTVQWVPLPNTISLKTQYLAISYKCNYNKFTRVINQKSHKTLILIFKLESLVKEFGTFSNLDSSLLQCEFQYGIICDNGPIHDMKFLPSGGYDASINRLGLVAVANVDNNVNIYSLPIETPQSNCDTLNGNIKLIRLKPVMKLTLNYGIEDNDEIKKKKDHYFVQCHKIVWSKTKGHNMIGTGYANGCVALWNIEKECNLNCFKSSHDDDTLHFTPISYFRISDKYITSLDFHYDDKQPRWLIAASHSRTIRIFDIENPSSPTIILEDLSKSFITAVNWPLVWENLICASSSDLCLAGPLTYSPMQLLFLRRRCAVIPSGVTCLDFNPWTNICIIATENGDFTFEFRSEYNLDCTLKRYLLTKSFTYTDLIKLDGSKHQFIDENNVQNKKKDNNLNNDKNMNVESGETRLENSEPLKFFDKDYRNKYGLVFGPLTFHKELSNSYQSEKRCPQFNLNCYVRINTVACNTNYHGSNFNAAGYENGFIRIFYKKIPRIQS